MSRPLLADCSVWSIVAVESLVELLLTVELSFLETTVVAPLPTLAPLAIAFESDSGRSLLVSTDAVEVEFVDVEFVDVEGVMDVMEVDASRSDSSSLCLKSALDLRTPCFFVTICVFKWFNSPYDLVHPGKLQLYLR